MKSRTQKIALSGISGALTVIFLLGSVYLPVANIAFWVAAALCLLIPLAGGNSGILFSLLVFAGSSAIALMAGDYFQVLPFICFFGPYSVFWFYLKKVKLSVYLRYIIQYVFLFFAVWICYALIKSLAFDHVAEIDLFLREKWWLALIIVAAGVPVYNFALKEGWVLVEKAYAKYKQSN